MDCRQYAEANQVYRNIHTAYPRDVLVGRMGYNFMSYIGEKRQLFDTLASMSATFKPADPEYGSAQYIHTFYLKFTFAFGIIFVSFVTVLSKFHFIFVTKMQIYRQYDVFLVYPDVFKVSMPLL